MTESKVVLGDCSEEGMSFTGIEVDEHYRDIAMKRLGVAE